MTQEEIDGLEKLRSLLFHHSWKNEENFLANRADLNRKIIHAIKSTEGTRSAETSLILDGTKIAVSR